MTQIAQPYNLFAQQKQQGYNSYQQPQQVQQQVTAPYNPMGETVQDFAAGKQAANSQAQGYGANPVTTTQTFTQPQNNNVVANGGTTTAGGTQKPITSMEDLATAMGYTSPKQEEKLRKASVANQRILAVGDALRHIGNIFNTVRYAPAQKFNSPVQEEYERYQRGKALRDKANLTYLNYQQQKAIQDAKQKQWEQQFRYNAAKDAANFELKKNESEARMQRQKALAELDKARLEGQLDKNTYARLVNQYYPETAEAKIREIESRIAKNGRTGGGSGSRGGRGGSNMPDYEVVTTYDRDDEGRVKSQKKTRTVKHTDGTKSTSTKTTQPKKKALPGQTQPQPQKQAKKRLPGM